MRHKGRLKRQKAAVTNASTKHDGGRSRKHKKTKRRKKKKLKKEVADGEHTLYDFKTVYGYLVNTKPKREFEDFAMLKKQYMPLLVDKYARPHNAEQDLSTSKASGHLARLPKDGGIFLDDIPLHHRTSSPLHPLEEQRLKLCGLALKNGKWTRKEDEALVENWREYATHNNVPLLDAPRFFGSTKEDSLEFRERKQYAQATLFNPWICKRLLRRTCQQIRRRGRVLLHRNYRLRGPVSWTPDDDELLLKLAKVHNGRFKEVALQMGRINEYCLKRYYLLLKRGVADNGTMPKAKKRRSRGGTRWPAADAQRLQHLLDRFGSQLDVVALWMDRSKYACKKYAEEHELKFERRSSRQKTVVERYPIEPWSVEQLQELTGFLREVLPCNVVKFLHSEEYVGFEHRIDWHAASERTTKSATECRMKWSDFKEYILEQASNGGRKKDILQGLLHFTGAMKQRVKIPRRKWTAAEVQQLMDMVGEMGRCWVKIGRELNREPSACMKRYYAYRVQTTEWTQEELQRFYEFLDDTLQLHPVVAARRRGGDCNIFWEDAASVIGKSVCDCRNMWKRLKAQFPVSQQHLQAHDVYKIAQHALQRCLVQVKEELAERDEAEALEGTEPPPAEAVHEEAENAENVAPASPLPDVTPSQLSHCITILLEQDTLKSKRDFDADWLQINLHKTPSFACGSGDLVRHVRRMLRRCKRAGMWARLPLEQQTLRGKLETLEFVLSRSEELLVPSHRFRKLLKKFVKQREFALLPRDDATEQPDFVDLRFPSSSE